MRFSPSEWVYCEQWRQILRINYYYFDSFLAYRCFNTFKNFLPPAIPDCRIQVKNSPLLYLFIEFCDEFCVSGLATPLATTASSSSVSVETWNFRTHVSAKNREHSINVFRFHCSSFTEYSQRELQRNYLAKVVYQCSLLPTVDLLRSDTSKLIFQDNTPLLLLEEFRVPTSGR